MYSNKFMKSSFRSSALGKCSCHVNMKIHLFLRRLSVRTTTPLLPHVSLHHLLHPKTSSEGNRFYFVMLPSKRKYLFELHQCRFFSSLRKSSLQTVIFLQFKSEVQFLIPKNLKIYVTAGKRCPFVLVLKHSPAEPEVSINPSCCSRTLWQKVIYYKCPASILSLCQK